MQRTALCNRIFEMSYLSFWDALPSRGPENIRGGLCEIGAGGWFAVAGRERLPSCVLWVIKRVHL
jgi:hypothetical protein